MKLAIEMVLIKCVYKNRMNPDQLASADASLSRSTLFSKDGKEL